MGWSSASVVKAQRTVNLYVYKFLAIESTPTLRKVLGEPNQTAVVTIDGKFD